MNRNTAFARGLTALSLIAAGMSGTAGVAMAAPAAPYCEPGSDYEVVSVDRLWRPANDMPSFADGPGGTITATVERATEITATFGTRAEAEFGAIFATVKAEVSASVSRAESVSVGHAYTRKIKPGHIGHLEYGSRGYEVHWTLTQYYSNCEQKVVDRGVAKVPTKYQGWKYWETKA